MVGLVFLYPRHLDRFELSLGGPFRVVLEILELGDPLMQIGVADVRWVDVWKFLIECKADVFALVPGQFRHRFSSLSKLPGPQSSSCSRPASWSPDRAARFSTRSSDDCRDDRPPAAR